MKNKTLFTFFIFIVLLSGCKIQNPMDRDKVAEEKSNEEKSDEETPKEETTQEKVHNKLMSLESYMSDSEVEFVSNKNSTKYSTIQYAKNDGKYRIEVTAPNTVKGNITISDGINIYQYNPRLGSILNIAIKDDQAQGEVFVTTFLKNYLESKNVSVSASNFDDGMYTVLEATVPLSHQYLTTQKLFVNNETLEPVKLVVCDSDDMERIVVTYTNFKYNMNIDDNLFSIKK